MSVFLKDFLNYPSSPITDALPLFFGTSKNIIFQFVRKHLSLCFSSFFFLSDLRVESHIYFGEFVDVICSICFFEQIDLLKFMFRILDPTKTGFVDKVKLNK